MKIRIVAKDGELGERLPDVIRAIRKLAGEPLEKATKEPDSEPMELELPILEKYVEQGSAVAEKVRKRMMAQIAKVLDE
jgi:hypothetical protein